MNRLCLTCVLLGAAGLTGCASPAGDDHSAAPSRDAASAASATNAGERPAMTTKNANRLLEFTVEDIDGREVSLERYRGQVMLIVNVASKCGLTPQYKELQQLHERYADDGLAILGFPANDFMRQEPGTNPEIKEFCTTKYGVEFDLFAKVSVKGRDKCALYRFLTSKETNPDFAGELKWNFTKFLVDRQGRVIARFEPRTRPSDSEVVSAIEAALKRPA